MYRLSLLLLPLLIFACQPALGPVTVVPRLYEVEAEEAALTRVPGEVGEMQATIAPYKEQLDGKMNRVLAQVKTPLTKGGPESNLGNWMADVMYAAALEYFPEKPIAFAVTNPGGLRVAEIGAGPLIVSEIYELMPFDNMLVTVELTGAQVEEFLTHVAATGGWPVSEQLRLSRADGELSIQISGQPLDPAATYHVATIDYVADGGSDAAMLPGKPRDNSDQLLRDILIDFAGRSEGPIDVRATGERMRL